ncbi:hypothetical protein IIB79_12460 [candidate division KSB1 bacterium]|nr:hypothetical protein [candidate division KSB1 bacterium]
MPPQLAIVIPRLLEHEISVKRLSEPVEVEVEVYYAQEITHNQYFQGHYLKEVTAEKRTETIQFPAGSFFVPSGQARSNLISYLLEPETNDNLITWGYLDSFLRVTSPGQRGGGRGQLAGRGGRGGRGRGGQPQEQRIPIYRLMKKTNLKGTLVTSFNEYEKNRYIKYIK